MDEQPAHLNTSSGPMSHCLDIHTSLFSVSLSHSLCFSLNSLLRHGHGSISIYYGLGLSCYALLLGHEEGGRRKEEPGLEEWELDTVRGQGRKLQKDTGNRGHCCGRILLSPFSLEHEHLFSVSLSASLIL